MTSSDEATFGRHIADLLDRLSKGDQQAADLLWDAGSQLPDDKRKQLEERVHTELEKLGLE